MCFIMKRTRRSQTKHDSRVHRVAGGYKSQGWKVKADVRGYSAPRTIMVSNQMLLQQKERK